MLDLRIWRIISLDLEPLDELLRVGGDDPGNTTPSLSILYVPDVILDGGKSIELSHHS